MKILPFCLLLLLSTYLTQAQPDREPLFTSFDGTKLHYDVLGTGRRAVVLLHGFIVNGDSWKRAPLRQMLADSGYTVVTLDLRGNGRSDKPHTASAYQDDAELKDVLALMTYLGHRQYDVVGYSRGAILAARLLDIAPPNTVRKAVLGGMGLDFSDPNWYRRRHFYEALNSPGSHPELQPAIDYALKTGADTVALKFMQQFQPVTTQAELRRIQQPVLVISGDQDEDNGRAADLATALPNAQLATVPGTHNNTMSSPAFAQRVMAFLK